MKAGFRSYQRPLNFQLLILLIGHHATRLHQGQLMDWLIFIMIAPLQLFTEMSSLPISCWINFMRPRLLILVLQKFFKLATEEGIQPPFLQALTVTSLLVTEKSDVYSFGVALLELITGRGSIETEFGENKNIVSWTSGKILKSEDLIAVLDSKISKSFKDQMIQVLKIAVSCTHKLPALRPSMREVVQMLLDADPCKLQVKFNS